MPSKPEAEVKARGKPDDYLYIGSHVRVLFTSMPSLRRQFPMIKDPALLSIFENADEECKLLGLKPYDAGCWKIVIACCCRYRNKAKPPKSRYLNHQ